MDKESVGSALLRSAPLSTEHPLFKAVAVQTSVRLREIMGREEVRRKSTKKMLSFVSLNPEEAAVLRLLFPEFQLVDYGCEKPGHSFYCAARDLANEWCIMQSERYTQSLAHVGGTATLHLQSSRHDVHLLGDVSDDVYAHALHESVLNATRITRDVASVSKLLGRVVPPVALMNFFNGTKLVPCSRNNACTHSSEALVVDGSMVVMSPHQVAATMMQLSSSVAFGFFPYSPGMLVSDEGRLDRTGLHYKRTGLGDESRFEIMYPEGRCGVQSYPLPVWAAWVREQIITFQGKHRDRYFQLELLDNRGPFMFYRMVKLDAKPENTRYLHALDLPMNKELYTVISWRLRFVGADPRFPESWEKFSFTADKRLVDRVYGFGMQLSAKDFTRFSIRKQLKAVNDRVVVNGTAVTWHAPLTPDEIDQLSIALFAKLFVDRYDSGKLSSELLSRLKRENGFERSSAMTKRSFIAHLGLSGLWDSANLHLDERIRELCDKFHRYLHGEQDGKQVHVRRPPVYMTMETVAKTWFQTVGETLSGRPSYPSAYIHPAFPGILCSPKVTKYYTPPTTPSGIYNDVADVPGRLVVALDGAEIDGSSIRVDLETREVCDLKEQAWSLVSAFNEVDYEPVDRHVDLAKTVKRGTQSLPSVLDHDVDPDPVHTFNAVYEECLVGNNLTNSQSDMASNVLDPQDRNLSAVHLKMGLARDPPKPVAVFRSKIKALNVTKRQDIMTELLSACAARNTDPPVVSKPQDFDSLIPDIWRRFKLVACRSDVECVLAKFRDDPVALGEGAYRQWMSQAKDLSVLERVVSQVEKEAKSMEEYNVADYMVMIKADVKVPLSTKVQIERTEPQVIVYHDKVLSALYSSVFRVLVTRFLAILKPNVHINLRKDTKDIADFIHALHPFDLIDTGQKVCYLENDFSKYDKSQLEMAFTLEKFIFEQLGMNKEFVDAWFLGHVDCKLRSLIHSFTLHVAWQRKSGDATTAFGNVILNAMSVLYAYPVSDVYWMVFMGDDSIVCSGRVAGYEDAVGILAEVFNLQAKTYVTTAPYFASNFIVIEPSSRYVGLLPDPIKRTERWSMSESVHTEKFSEKYVSSRDVCGLYKYKCFTNVLKFMVPERYPVSAGQVELLSSAIATVISDEREFRNLWECDPTIELG